MNTHLTPNWYSLQQRLANDEVLAVAYQYTIGDKVYQVGEFGNDGIDATIVTMPLQIGLLSRKA
jgi:cell surface protein SprA